MGVPRGGDAAERAWGWGGVQWATVVSQKG